MADEVTSGEIRTRRFDVVRKGYDRSQVETFLALVARRFDAFESGDTSQTESAPSLGIEDADGLAHELGSIGGEIGAILEAARSAAEAIRNRAAADAEAWTSEAKTFVEDSTSEAESAANTVRGAAWDEGSALLEVATEESNQLVAEAQTDALRIRAEAEREAIRHTTDAKRASEESIGAAENEAEGILASSRAESERVLRAANQAAETAQERARALEDRRAELLAELESTRSSIGDLETEIESKRQELEEPEPEVVPIQEERSHHEPDGGSVRIVSGSKVLPFKPVDADSFVAEVAEMHRSRPGGEDPSGKNLPPTADGYPPEEEPQAEEGSQGAANQPPSAVRYPPDEEPSAAESPELKEPVSVSPLPQPAGGDFEERDRGGSLEDAAPSDEVPPEDAIGSLFAQLREGSEQLTVDSSQSEASRQPSAISRQPSSEPADTQPILDTEEGESPESASLIPVQNAALRSIKRLLVDLQNDALEHLRTDKTWVPEENFTDRFSEPFGELATAITDDGDDQGAATVFATDLYDAVSNAVIAGREAGSGDRAIAAATSKVFRMWRSDEAERRVVAAASDLSKRS